MTALEACNIAADAYMRSKSELHEALATLQGVKNCNISPMARAMGIRSPAIARARIRKACSLED